METEPSAVSDDRAKTESIGAQSSRKNKRSGRRNECDDDDDDDDDVERWAKAIIRYHQQTQDIRIRYETELRDFFVVNSYYNILKIF